MTKSYHSCPQCRRTGKFMGIESQCMILAAEDNHGSVVIIQPEQDVREGSPPTKVISAKVALGR